MLLNGRYTGYALRREARRIAEGAEGVGQSQETGWSSGVRAWLFEQTWKITARGDSRSKDRRWDIHEFESVEILAAHPPLRAGDAARKVCARARAFRPELKFRLPRLPEGVGVGVPFARLSDLYLDQEGVGVGFPW